MEYNELRTELLSADEQAKRSELLISMDLIESDYKNTVSDNEKKLEELNKKIEDLTVKNQDLTQANAKLFANNYSFDKTQTKEVEPIIKTKKTLKDILNDITKG